MKHLIVIFLWTFINFGSGNPQNIPNNAIQKYKSQQPDDNMTPVTAEYISPEEAYQTYHSKFESSLQRNIKPEPCSNSKLQDEPAKSNQQVNLPNRRTHENDVYNPSKIFDSANLQSQRPDEDNQPKVRTHENDVYNPSKIFDSANLQSQRPDEDNQPKVINNGNRRNDFQNPVLKNSDYDLLGTIDALEMIRSSKDSNFIDLENEKEKTNEMNDLRTNTDRLMNILSTTMKPISNIQCEDENRLRSFNDISRRFLISENKKPLNNNNFQQINGNLNTNNDLDSNLNNVNPIDLKFGFNKLPTSENDAYRAQPLSNQYINKLRDPTIGQGISYMNKGEFMLMDYDKVCYACSSANNPTCFSPDRRTTVKYCRKGVNSCSTKSFRTGSTITLIRDCSNSCDDSEVQSLGLKYQSCSICHSDLCNNATYNNAHSLKLTLPGLALIVLVKAFI